MADYILECGDQKTDATGLQPGDSAYCFVHGWQHVATVPDVTTPEPQTVQAVCPNCGASFPVAIS